MRWEKLGHSMTAIVLGAVLLAAADVGAAGGDKAKPKHDLTPRDADGTPCLTFRVLTERDRCAHQTMEDDESHCHPDMKYRVEFRNHCDRTVYVTYHLDGWKPESSRRGAAVVKPKSTQPGSLVLLKTLDGSSGQVEIDSVIGE